MDYDYIKCGDCLELMKNIPDGEYYISIDYGTMNPFSAGLWCVLGDKATRIKEYYYNGREKLVQRTNEDYCDSVEELAKGYNIRHMKNKIGKTEYNPVFML